MAEGTILVVEEITEADQETIVDEAIITTTIIVEGAITIIMVEEAEEEIILPIITITTRIIHKCNTHQGMSYHTANCKLCTLYVCVHKMCLCA